MRSFIDPRFLPLVAGLLGLAPGPLVRAAERTAIQVIVVAGFEVGADTGDTPGEFQFWYEREGLTEKTTILRRAHALCHNAKGLYGIVGGNSTDKDLSPNSEIELITALCLDPRFDLRKTYWIVDGIAGIDPAVGSIGSAAWAENVVDGDALREIDDRQLPSGWPYGLFAIGTKGPNQLPTSEPEKGGGWGGAALAYSMNHPSTRGWRAGPSGFRRTSSWTTARPWPPGASATWGSRRRCSRPGS